MRYKWKLLGSHNIEIRSGEITAKNLTVAKRMATARSGINTRLWSNWYETEEGHYRDNDINGLASPAMIKFLVLT